MPVAAGLLQLPGNFLDPSGIHGRRQGGLSSIVEMSAADDCPLHTTFRWAAPAPPSRRRFRPTDGPGGRSPALPVGPLAILTSRRPAPAASRRQHSRFDRQIPKGPGSEGEYRGVTAIHGDARSRAAVVSSKASQLSGREHVKVVLCWDPSGVQVSGCQPSAEAGSRGCAPRNGVPRAATRCRR